MVNADARVTIHMAASLDGFIARKDGSVDWLETSDHFEGGEVMAPESVAELLRTIDPARTLHAPGPAAGPRPTPAGRVHR